MKTRTVRKAATYAIAATVMTGLLAVVGCTSQTPSGGSGTDAKAPLKIWLNSNNNEDAWKSALSEFQGNTGIQVTPTFFTGDPYKQQIANATGTSAMPDVFVQWSGIGLLGNLYDAKALAPMEKYYSKYSWGERFSKTALASITIDGAEMGVPFETQKMAVVYKKSTFKELGVTPPATFAELEEANKTFKAAKITPWIFAGKGSWDPMRLTDSLLEMTCGAEGFDSLRHMDTDWESSQCAVEAFQKEQSWLNDGYLPSGYMGLDPATNVFLQKVIDGEAAMTIDGNWSGTTLKKLGANPDDYAYFPFPTGTDRLSYFATSLYMSATSKNPDGAATLIDYLTDPETVNKYPGILQGSLPAMNGTKISSDSEYDEGWVSLGSEMTGVYGPSDQEFPPAVAQTYLLNTDKLQLGQQTPQETVAKIQDGIDTYKETK